MPTLSDKKVRELYNEAMENDAPFYVPSRVPFANKNSETREFMVRAWIEDKEYITPRDQARHSKFIDALQDAESLSASVYLVEVIEVSGFNHEAKQVEGIWRASFKHGTTFSHDSDFYNLLREEHLK